MYIKKKIPRVLIPSGPYKLTLHCPYCGELILKPEVENTGDCPHLVLSDMESDPEDNNEEEFRKNGFCIEMFESAPANRSHYFVFRENPG